MEKVRFWESDNGDRIDLAEGGALPTVDDAPPSKVVDNCKLAFMHALEDFHLERCKSTPELMRQGHSYDYIAHYAAMENYLNHMPIHESFENALVDMGFIDNAEGG